MNSISIMIEAWLTKFPGTPEKALADYTKALELKPDYANALNNRGVIYLQKGLYDKAIEDFTGALKVH